MANIDIIQEKSFVDGQYSLMLYKNSRSYAVELVDNDDGFAFWKKAFSTETEANTFFKRACLKDEREGLYA